MTFEVYNKHTNTLVVRIENEKVYIAETFAKPLRNISVESCFTYNMTYNMPNEKESIFGRVKKVTRNDKELYPIALRMYCEANFLTHPDDYSRSPS